MQVVSAAGAVDHSQLVQLAEKAFSGLPAEGLSSKEYIDKASPLGKPHHSYHYLLYTHALLSAGMRHTANMNLQSKTDLHGGCASDLDQSSPACHVMNPV